MADLTPPASQSNTPQKQLLTPEPPSSPIRAAHPLATSSAPGDIDMAASTTLPPSGSGPPAPLNARALETTDSDEGEVSDGEILEEGMELDAQSAESSDGEIKLPSEGVPLGRVESRGKRRADSGRADRRSKKGKGRADPSSTFEPRRGEGKKGKEGDLYESDIVARWNSDFGDPCHEPDK